MYYTDAGTRDTEMAVGCRQPHYNAYNPYGEVHVFRYLDWSRVCFRRIKDDQKDLQNECKLEVKRTCSVRKNRIGGRIKKRGIKHCYVIFCGMIVMHYLFWCYLLHLMAVYVFKILLMIIIIFYFDFYLSFICKIICLYRR